MATAPLLAIEGLDCSYGPLRVLFGVDLAVPAGGRVALLGTNGAGKSTLLRAVCGLLRPDAGRIVHDGVDITAHSTRDRVVAGIGMVAGGRASFPSLSVAENLRMGGYTFRRDGRRLETRLREVLELFPALGDRVGQRAGTLSGGEQQMMAIGRALMSDPSLLLIDELSLGLAPVVMADIVAAIEQIAERGTTLVLVEQSLNVAVALTDTAVFMEKGEIRFSGPTAELADRGDLARSVFFGNPSTSPRAV